MASAGGELIKLWNLETGTLLREMNQNESVAGTSAFLTFSPHGGILATGGEGTVQFWDVASGRSLAVFRGHASERLDGLALSPDSDRLATAAGREVKLWDARTGKEILTLPLSEFSATDGPGITALSWTKEGKSLRAGLRDGSVIAWETAPRAAQ